MPSRSGKSNGKLLVAIFLAAVVVIAVLASGFEYWSPTRFTVDLSIIPDGGGGGAVTTVAGPKITYETWQDWHIQLVGSYSDRYISAKKTFGFPLEVGKTVLGRLYYAWIDIPMVQIGVLPSYGTIATQSYWYLQDEIYGTAKVYLQDRSHFVGEANLVPIRFGPSDVSGTTKNLRLYVGTHDGIRYVKANYQVGTAEAVDIESYLMTQGLAGAKQYTLLVEYTVVCVTYKIRPFLPGGTGESIQTLRETSSPVVPGQVTLMLPETWTGTYSTGFTFQTITKSVGGTETVTRIIIIPSTVVIIQPTTICGTAGVCVTFTGVSTVFSGWTTTETITVQPSPIPDICGLVPWLPWCSDWLAWFKGSTWGIPNWLILLGIIIVVLWILSKLFAPKVSIGR